MNGTKCMGFYVHTTEGHDRLSKRKNLSWRNRRFIYFGIMFWMTSWDRPLRWLNVVVIVGRIHWRLSLMRFEVINSVFGCNRQVEKNVNQKQISYGCRYRYSRKRKSPRRGITDGTMYLPLVSCTYQNLALKR